MNNEKKLNIIETRYKINPDLRETDMSIFIDRYDEINNLEFRDIYGRYDRAMDYMDYNTRELFEIIIEPYGLSDIMDEMRAKTPRADILMIFLYDFIMSDMYHMSIDDMMNEMMEQSFYNGLHYYDNITEMIEADYDIVYDDNNDEHREIYDNYQSDMMDDYMFHNKDQFLREHLSDIIDIFYIEDDDSIFDMFRLYDDYEMSEINMSDTFILGYRLRYIDEDTMRTYITENYDCKYNDMMKNDETDMEFLRELDDEEFNLWMKLY